MRLKSLDAILTTVLLATVVSGFAHTWEQTSTIKNFDTLSMSADGRIICAVPSGSHPLISTNFGETWVLATDSPAIGGIAPNGIAISADGTKIHALNLAQSSWISTNFGLTWTQTGFPAAAAWRIACSADGTKVIASAFNGPLYYSTNSGANCYPASVPNAKWTSLASSADGRRMAATVNGGDLYFSMDYGASWTPAGFSSRGFASVCVSADGKWVGATTDTNTYISSNAGVVWSTNNLGGSIACSANGSNWVIAGGQLYTSTNGGVNWITNLPTVAPLTAAISADGCEISVLDLNGIWMGRATQSPQLNIQSRDSNLELSWLLPSTNFVLQLNTDLENANWAIISNNPALNFTNLQQEVSVPAGANNAFFRLIAQ